MKKLIVVIEVEMERDVPGIETEICQRITMHPHVRDANPLSVGPSLDTTHAPKPSKPIERSYLGATPKA